MRDHTSSHGTFFCSLVEVMRGCCKLNDFYPQLVAHTHVGCLILLFCSSGTRKEFCCYGYAIDLLIDLSKEVNFTYGLHLVEDNNYGTYEKVTKLISLTFIFIDISY